MSNPVPSSPKPAGSPTPGAVEAAPVAPDFSESLRQFWTKNATTVYIGCAVVLLAIVARDGFGWYRRQHDAAIQAEYAAAGSSRDRLKAFAEDHADNPLAGIARLRMADDEYSNRKYSEAVADYQKAADQLTVPVLKGRALLGVAAASLYSGKPEAAVEKWKQLSGDVGMIKAVRAEAAYDLASQSMAAGRYEEAVKYLDLVSSIEPNGTWAQRAFGLRTTLPPGAVPAPTATNLGPTLTVPAKP